MIKRVRVIGFVLLFLLQAFAGIQFLYGNHEEKEITVDAVPVRQNIADEGPGTRGIVYENNSTGGSWLDDFADESGIEWKENVSIVNGSVRLADNEIIPGTNTTAIWHFNEGAGNATNDTSGNGNNGILNGTNWTNGAMGQGLEFDGDDDYLEVLDNPALDITNKISIEAWIMPEVSNEINPAIVYHYDGNGWYLLLREGNTSSPKPAFSGLNINEAKSSVGLTIGKWNYIAITYDRQKVRIFINGILTNDTIETDALTKSTSSLTIGSTSHANNAFFKGKIDEVAIYDRALTPSEIYNHSQRFHTNATLKSTPISLPQYYSWDSLVIDKTKHANHNVNVSIIDNSTNKTIVGFSNLNTSGVINISSIDLRNHTTIRLNATFEGNGTDTPLLHSWAVNWTNKRPVLGEPVGMMPVNRTETINISFRASDHEEYTPNLNFTAQYKLNSNIEWNNADANDIDWNATHFFFNLTPPVDAELGVYDMRFRLNDSLNASTGWKSYLSSFLVKNNIPVYDNLSISANEVTRAYPVILTVLNVSDVEKDLDNLTVSFYHRLNGTAEWSEDFIWSGGDRNDNKTVEFNPNRTSTLGYYDIMVSLNDNDSITNKTYPNLIFVKNNLPTLENMSMESDEALRTAECILVLDKLEDIEKESMDLQLTFSVRENGTSAWEPFEALYVNEIAGKARYSCGFDSDAPLGQRDIMINVSDGDDNVSFMRGSIVTVTNNLPLISANFTNLLLREDPKNFSLIGFGSDVEDDETELTWSWNLSTVNSTLIDDIVLLGTNLTITPAADANGSNDVEFILTDLNGDSASKLVTITVTPFDIELAAILSSPSHEAVINTTSALLEWKLMAADPVAVVTYDIYFGDDLGKVKNHNGQFLLNSTTDRSYAVYGLVNGTKYFWTVIPRNVTATGISDPLYYWFEVDIVSPIDNNTAPTVELLLPGNGAVLNDPSAELGWKGYDKDNDSISYSVFVSQSFSDVENRLPSAIINETLLTTHLNSSLEKGKTYYWTVIPNDGKANGTCISGIWSFITTDIPPPNATITAHATQILAGEKVTFTIHFDGKRSNGTDFLVNFYDGEASPWIIGGTVTHVFETAGKYPVSITARVNGVVVDVPGSVVITVVDQYAFGLNFTQPIYGGDDPTKIAGNITGVDWMSDNLTLRAELNGNLIDITPAISWLEEISDDYLLEGINTITVKLFFKGILLDSVDRNITVVKDDGVDGDKGGISPVLWIGLIILILVVICVLFLLTRKKKKEEEIEDTIVSKLPEYKCPECGEFVERESVSCDQCGAEFDEPTVVGEEEPQEETEEILEEDREKPGTEERDPEISGEKTPVPLDIQAADESYSCKICFGVIKTGLPVVTCTCGKHYHEECIKRVGECPACNAVPDLGISDPSMDSVMAPPEVLNEEMAAPPPEVPPEAPPMDFPPEIPPTVQEPVAAPPGMLDEDTGPLSPEVPVDAPPEIPAAVSEPQSIPSDMPTEEGLPNKVVTPDFPPVAPPGPPAVVSVSSPEDYAAPVSAAIVVVDQSVQCRICLGVVKTGLKVIQCSCGKIYHASCGIRVGECPSCSYDYKEFIDQVDEEALIENVKDSIESGTKEIESKVEELTTDNLLMQLKKQLVNRELSIDEFYEKKKALTE